MIIKTKHDIDFNINAESVDEETANSFIEEDFTIVYFSFDCKNTVSISGFKF